MKPNVHIYLLKDKKIVDERHVHNVTTHYGRQFFRNAVAVGSIDNINQNNRYPRKIIYDNVHLTKKEAIVFGAIGVGSIFQTYELNINGNNISLKGNFSENMFISCLERPIPINKIDETSIPPTFAWYKPIQYPMQNEGDYNLRVELLLESDEVNLKYPEQGDNTYPFYTIAPISEIGLYTTDVQDTTTPPTYSTYGTTGNYQIPGFDSSFPINSYVNCLVAYVTFSPIYKLPDMEVYVDWILNF
jgi:hypothetical protein